MANYGVANEKATRDPAALTELERLFQKEFGSKARPRFFQAPGRVNLIGEHTDYNDGFVMPAAIDFRTLVAAATREDGKLAVHSVNFEETQTFDLNQPNPSPKHHWSDYVRGVAVEMQKAGLALRGVNLLLKGNVPLGSGLSSSASVEMATALALTNLSGGTFSRSELATICQRAENEFVGARCGIMDQFISAHGRSGHALMLDCRSLDYELLPLPESVALVICNTMVKHQIATGEYNVRRRECEEGVSLLRQKYPEVHALRDVTAQMLESSASLLPEVIRRRCQHVVTENERVVAAANALRTPDLKSFGRSMKESHESMRDDYEISCAEVDAMVEIASKLPGVIGARMTGGGFGGCTINLVEREAVEQFCEVVAEEYCRRTRITPAIYVTQASEGASETRMGEAS